MITSLHLEDYINGKHHASWVAGLCPALATMIALMMTTLHLMILIASLNKPTPFFRRMDVSAE